MSRSRTARPVRAWLAGALLALLSAGAPAAGPTKLASYDRTLWPESIDSPQRFDRASRQEILALVRVIERTPLADAAAIQTFTGVKTPNAEGVARWLEETRRRLLANYRAASRSCEAEAFCPPAADWPALVQLAGQAAGDTTTQAWRQAAEGFHTTYLYEQVRLAALFPRITSEIARLDDSELNGFELPDRQFALSFDDGPSGNDETERLLHWLREHGAGAFFFVLGENLERRLARESAASLGERYQGQCLASHGYSHIPHQKLAGWQDSLEKTARLIARVQPAGPAGGAWFRPPYGQRNAEQVAYLKARDGRVVLWNIDSQDWNAKLQPAAMQDRLITLMLLWRRGILLFHDIHPKARTALPGIGAFMEKSGLAMVGCGEVVEGFGGES
ncbi:polysaccharide deacetylase family protein [Azotobacter chroococcum]|uniref:Polysaccharide deacetylase family protein n=1 Tax=Azotobacter chroococcum NCIMB 8003 TaxID=1328314 RepID=A0A0C4WIK0_9GAMM|nr:polysaccharide deacetylase family protein [Azotobacter chroococcum]AJE19521.1 Polysaccharide deacetylase family protein [Azotobacter chroococcum NCIMB 8003]